MARILVVDDDAPMPDRWRANALAHLAGLLLYDPQTTEAAELARQARDAAVAAGDDRVGIAEHYLLRAVYDRLHAAGALALNGHAGNGK